MDAHSDSLFYFHYHIKPEDTMVALGSHSRDPKV